MAIGLLAIGAILLGGPTPALASPPGVAVPRILGADSASAIPGSYIVKLKDNATLRSQGLSATAEELAGVHKGTVQHVWTHALHGFSVTMSEDEAKKLAADPEVASVQQDQYLRSAAPAASPNSTAPTASPNATQAPPTNWGLDRIDQRKPPLDQKYHYDSSKAGKGVTAYIISGGIRISHEDFQGRAFYGPNFVDDGRQNADDCTGAGTAVAGAVGGFENGVAKQANLVGVRVFGCNNIGAMSGIASGLDWVAGNAVRPAVVDLNLDSVCANPDTMQVVPCDPAEAALLVESVEGVIDTGILVVQKAGDQATDTCASDSGMAPNALYVGGTDITDARFVRSNYGACVDAWAPAVQINVDTAAGDNTEATFSSTGIAAGFVTGAAALLLSDPHFVNASPAQLTDQLVNKQSTPNVVTGLDAASPNKLLCTSPPGSFTVGSSVRLGTNANGSMALFGVNPNGFIMQRSQTGTVASVVNADAVAAAGSTTWGPWVQSATTGWDSVAADRNADGRIELIGITRTHELWHRQQAAANSNTWLGWTQLSNPSSLGINAVTLKLLANNRLMMFGSNQDGQGFFRTQTAANATTWGAWTALPFAGQARSITAESNTDGRIEVFVADTDGQVWHAKQVSANDTNWSSFTRISGAVNISVVAAARHSDGRLDLFATDYSGVLGHATQTGAGSSSYGAYGAPTTTGNLKSVTATTNGAGRIDIVAVDNAGSVWEGTETNPNTNTWGSFSQISAGGTLRP